MASKALMTLDEAAEYLSVSKVSLRRWTTQGLLKCVRIGTRGDRRFRKSDLEAYVRRNVSPKTASRKKPVAKQKAAT